MYRWIRLGNDGADPETIGAEVFGQAPRQVLDNNATSVGDGNVDRLNGAHWIEALRWEFGYGRHQPPGTGPSFPIGEKGIGDFDVVMDVLCQVTVHHRVLCQAEVEVDGAGGVG